MIELSLLALILFYSFKFIVFVIRPAVTSLTVRNHTDTE